MIKSLNNLGVIKKMKLEGRLLGNRYEILESKGTISKEEAREFAEKITELTNIKTVMQDERGTTITAHNFLNTTNTRGKKRKNVVDEVAATIILQDFLDSRKAGI